MKNFVAKIVSAPALRPLWSGVALLTITCAARGQFYAVTEIGVLGGTNCLAYGINNHEQIVGTAQTGMGAYHAFMFEGGRMMDLGTMGGSNSWAFGVNDNGWIVGASDMATTNRHGFLCTNALTGLGMMDLGTLGGSNSAAWMINMHGEMVGWATMTNGSHHAFFMTNSMAGAMMDLGTAGGTNSEAYCINSNRMVVGYAMMSDGSPEPIMSTNAMMGSMSMMTMGMGGMGAAGGQEWFVNDMGQTAGQAQMSGGNHHAFVTGSGGMMGRMEVDLGTLGGTNSAAFCINNAGTVVGSADLSNGARHGFMVTNALGGMPRMTDLNSLIPANSGWELMEARGINGHGQIVGWGMYAGHTNAFLLTPVSAPVMMVSAPSPEVAGPGANVTLRMQMSASEPLTYQWLHDGAPMSGATAATLTLTAMNMTNAGRYSVTARNAVGTVANSSAAVGMFNMNLTNGSPRLTVAAPVGTGFRIDSSDAPGSGAAWQTMTNFTMFGSANHIGVNPPQGSRARFYRAVMMP
ncbi:MAG TPA: immunoglobulin domain-containing protein [Verrucomicrobiae bacterium]